MSLPLRPSEVLEGIENLGDSSGVTDDCKQVLAATIELRAGVGVVYAC